MTTGVYKLLNRHALVLGCFALVIGSMLSVLNWITADRIELNRSQHLSDRLTEVLPESYRMQASELKTSQLVDLKSALPRTVYVAELPNQKPAVILSAVAKDGYAGDIELLVGITYDGTVTGVRVTQHQETPGLGDDIDIKKSPWILRFDGTSLTAPAVWSLRRDGGEFDQLTGATITPRAVVKAVKLTLTFYHEHKQLIFHND